MIPLKQSTRVPTTSSLKSEATFGLTELRSSSGLLIQVTPSGAIYAIRNGTTLINQFIPGPAEDGFFRLILRWHTPGGASGWAPIVGPAVTHRSLSSSSLQWETNLGPGISCRSTLAIDPTQSAWSWRTILSNLSGGAVEVDVLIAQDLGLADEAAVRNNEAFTSQYIDLLPVRDERWGWVVLARQNQTAEGGAHPWLAMGCEKGAVAYSTDGAQFFGETHRLSGIPAAVGAGGLPSKRLQREFAMVGLQSGKTNLISGDATDVSFVARFLPDHPGASEKADVARLFEAATAYSDPLSHLGHLGLQQPQKAPIQSVFIAAPWQHGEKPDSRDLAAWFPGPYRNEEFASDGSLLAFFHGQASHVVTREKEALVARPHGHILRSGAWRWVDTEQFGTTCYAAGIFSAQAYMGNTTFGRLLPVVRSALGLACSGPARVHLGGRCLAPARHSIGV